MRLYSVQPLSVWNDLSQGHAVTARPFDNDHDDSWRTAYEWLSQQMKTRGVTNAPSPATPDFPMWAWYWYNGYKKTRPDLRNRMMRDWAKERRMVLLTLEVEDSRVLLSDYDGWHWALNYWFLARRRQANAFEKEIASKGNMNFYRTKPLADPAYHAQIQDSWTKMFDLEEMRVILDTPKCRQQVQATLWHLQKEDVVQALVFGMNQPSHAVDFSSHPHLS